MSATVRADSGPSQTPPSSARIVSLLPSATEIVCALGREEHVVGISHECDFPPSIRDRPALSRARISTAGSSRAIDAAVRSVVQDALSVYAVDDELLAKLKPDVIVTQDLCEVCAVSLDDVRAAVARLAQRESVQIVSLRPTRLADVLCDIEQVAEALNCRDEGQRVRAALQERIDRIDAAHAHVTNKPRVVSIEWIDPLMLGGTWMPELITLAGGIPVGAQAGQMAPTITPAQLTEMQPDVVLIKPCGFDIERTLQERDIIQQSIVHAVGDHCRVWLTDGNAYFNRPGPRLVESLEILAACLHPDIYGAFADKHAAVIRDARQL